MTSHATHYLDTQDLGPDTLRRQMQLVRLLKDADRRRACPELLRDASLGMIFEEASTRTRVSFEVAMTKLGGHALYLKPGEIHLGQKENIADTARVLSRMVDAVEIRAFHHETVTSFAKYATVPVINGLTDYNHPTQALCDVFTMGEHKLPDKHFADLTVVFVGDATNVCTSTAMIVTMLGGTFIHARPEAYSIERQWPQVIDEVKQNEALYGGGVPVDHRGRGRRARRGLRLHRPVVVVRPGGRDPGPHGRLHAALPGDAGTAGEGA